MATKRRATRILTKEHLRCNKRIRSTAQLSFASNWREVERVGRALLSLEDTDDDDDQHHHEHATPKVATESILVAQDHGSPSATPQQPPQQPSRMAHTNHRPLSTARALAIVAVWRTRVSKLPHAVESTADLAQLLWRDRQCHTNKNESTTTDTNTSTTPLTHMELRLTLSCAILRTINGLADTLQQQRSSAASVAVLCAELGVPSWLVDVRHEATHNRLPPLPTLRLAARALLQYWQTVYWEPSSECRWEKYDEAMAVLEEYEGMVVEYVATVSMETADTLDVDPAAGDVTTAVDDGSSSENDEIQRKGEDMWNHMAGTTFNPFSLLMGKKKKNKKTVVEAKPRKSKKPKLAPKKRKTLPLPNLLGCAHTLVKAKLPIDIAYDAMLDFFLNGYGEWKPGVMILSTLDLDKRIALYAPLLATIVKTWPGFLNALLNTAVALVVRTNPESETLGTEEHDLGRTLARWVQYLLSRKLLGKIDPLAKTPCPRFAKTDLESIASLNALRSLGIPLNRLCDQCSSATTVGAGRGAAAQLETLLSKILGSERSPHYGIEQRVVHASEARSARDANDGTDIQEEKRPLSLDEMEALLAKEDDAAPIGPHLPSIKTPMAEEYTDNIAQSVPPKWQRCTSWEPCAIGTVL